MQNLISCFIIQYIRDNYLGGNRFFSSRNRCNDGLKASPIPTPLVVAGCNEIGLDSTTSSQDSFSPETDADPLALIADGEANSDEEPVLPAAAVGVISWNNNLG